LRGEQFAQNLGTFAGAFQQTGGFVREGLHFPTRLADHVLLKPVAGGRRRDAGVLYVLHGERGCYFTATQRQLVLVGPLALVGRHGRRLDGLWGSPCGGGLCLTPRLLKQVALRALACAFGVVKQVRSVGQARKLQLAFAVLAGVGCIHLGLRTPLSNVHLFVVADLLGQLFDAGRGFWAFRGRFETFALQVELFHFPLVVQSKVLLPFGFC
jgi:hypothetical protein